MKLTPILVYTLLPVLAMVGGLGMMFAGSLPIMQQAVLVGIGGVTLTVALGGLSLFMALEQVQMSAVRVRAKRTEDR